MRGAWILAALVVLAAAVSPTATAAGRCGGALPRAPAGLPAPGVVTNDCGRFRLDSGGSAAYVGPFTMPVPSIAREYWPGSLTWFGIVHHHFVIGQGMKQPWRSRHAYRHVAPGDVEAIVLGRKKLAFSYYVGRRSRLFLAPFGGAERIVSRGEMPIAFTPAGDLVAWRYRGGALLLRHGDGSLDRRLAARSTDVEGE